MNEDKQRTIITGDKGNLGSYLKKILPGKIHGIGRNDWTDIEKLFTRNITNIIHCAYDLKSSYTNEPEKLLSSNLGNTARLLELCKLHNVKKFVFVSSCAVYGDLEDTSEDSVCCPQSINGIVKFLNEEIIKEFCKNNNIKFEIYRIFNMYGGDDNFSILYHLKNAVHNGMTLFLNNEGNAERDFIHVSDVAALIVKLMGMEHGYDCVNLGTGISTSISEIVGQVSARHAGIKIEKTCRDEVKKSVANMDRLDSLIKYDFMGIEQFIKEI